MHAGVSTPHPFCTIDDCTTVNQAINEMVAVDGAPVLVGRPRSCFLKAIQRLSRQSWVHEVNPRHLIQTRASVRVFLLIIVDAKKTPAPKGLASFPFCSGIVYIGILCIISGALLHPRTCGSSIPKIMAMCATTRNIATNVT